MLKTLPRVRTLRINKEKKYVDKNNRSKPQFKNKNVGDCFIYGKPSYFVNDCKNRWKKSYEESGIYSKDASFSTMVQKLI